MPSLETLNIRTGYKLSDWNSVAPSQSLKHLRLSLPNNLALLLGLSVLPHLQELDVWFSNPEVQKDVSPAGYYVLEDRVSFALSFTGLARHKDPPNVLVSDAVIRPLTNLLNLEHLHNLSWDHIDSDPTRAKLELDITFFSKATELRRIRARTSFPECLDGIVPERGFTSASPHNHNRSSFVKSSHRPPGRSLYAPTSAVLPFCYQTVTGNVTEKAAVLSMLKTLSAKWHGNWSAGTQRLEVVLKHRPYRPEKDYERMILFDPRLREVAQDVKFE
ncbi:hypothetical protein AX16_004804 [Volvariella volvacea WC 439]|nr:hypothetical protein AX16_004804 [Volvariella volvacea WC 439]